MSIGLAQHPHTILFLRYSQEGLLGWEVSFSCFPAPTSSVHQFARSLGTALYAVLSPFALFSVFIFLHLLLLLLFQRAPSLLPATPPPVSSSTLPFLFSSFLSFYIIRFSSIFHLFPPISFCFCSSSFHFPLLSFHVPSLLSPSSFSSSSSSSSIFLFFLLQLNITRFSNLFFLHSPFLHYSYSTVAASPPLYTPYSFLPSSSWFPPPCVPPPLSSLLFLRLLCDAQKHTNEKHLTQLLRKKKILKFPRKGRGGMAGTHDSLFHAPSRFLLPLTPRPASTKSSQHSTRLRIIKLSDWALCRILKEECK